MDGIQKDTEIYKRFESVKATEEQQWLIGVLREQFQTIALAISTIVPESREKSLALTKLEECSMWTNKGITHNKKEKDNE